MFRHIITDRHRGDRSRRRPAGACRQPAGRPRHDRRQDPHRARPGRSAEDGGEFPRLRQRQVLRRHAIPPRDQGLHDPGRRIHRPTSSRSRPVRRSRTRPSRAARRGSPTSRELSRWRAPATRTRRPRSSSSTSTTTSRSTSAKPTPQGYGYVVFGKVVQGMDVVNKIATAPTGSGGPFRQGRPGRARDHQERDRRDAIAMTMTILHTNHGAITIELDAGARAEERRQLPGLCSRRTLRPYDVPSRDRRLHGPGRRLRRRLQAEADQAADRERGEERPQERPLYRRDGAHVRSAFGDRAVLHQCRRQRLSQSSLAATPTAGAIACSDASSRARTSSIASRAFATGKRGGHDDVPTEDVVIERAEVVES